MPQDADVSESGFDDFLLRVVAGTSEVAVAYKPNLAFFEPHAWGEAALVRLVQGIRRLAPGALIIGDAKRGDISNTTRGYARAAFDRFDFDAVTANPYMGLESLEPFIACGDRATMVLCLTSNPGAAEFQNVGTPALFERVAERVAARNAETGNLWLVVGATHSGDEIARVRQLAPRVPILLPGVGAQGGDLKVALGAAGVDCLVNVGRTILYGARSLVQVEDAARGAAAQTVAQMREHVPGLGL